jgi:hypothetical protein
MSSAANLASYHLRRSGICMRSCGVERGGRGYAMGAWRDRMGWQRDPVALRQGCHAVGPVRHGLLAAQQEAGHTRGRANPGSRPARWRPSTHASHLIVADGARRSQPRAPAAQRSQAGRRHSCGRARRTASAAACGPPHLLLHRGVVDERLGACSGGRSRSLASRGGRYWLGMLRNARGADPCPMHHLKRDQKCERIKSEQQLPGCAPVARTASPSPLPPCLRAPKLV